MLNFTEAQINDKLLNMASLLDLNTGFKGLWWKKLESSEGWGAITTNITHYNLYSGSGSASYTVTLYYCDEVTIDYDNGTVMEVSNTKSSFSINMLSYKNANVMKGKYFLQTQSGISKTYLIYFPTDTEFKQDETTGTVYATKVIVKENPIKTKTLSDYVCSSDINAYPNGDYAEDGYYYELDKSVVVDKVYKWRKGIATQTYNTKQVTNESIYFNYNSYPNKTYEYGDNFYISDGKFYISNARILTANYATFSNAVKGHYLIDTSTDVTRQTMWKIDSDATLNPNASNSSYYVDVSTCIRYTNPNITLSNVEYVNSLNENAYPNGGEQDGYYYDSREEIKLGGAKITTGSYVGTESSTLTLHFEFEPELILISTNYSSNNHWAIAKRRADESNYYGYTINTSSSPTSSSNVLGYGVSGTIKDKTVRLTSYNSVQMCNIGGYTYDYIAIG